MFLRVCTGNYYDTCTYNHERGSTFIIVVFYRMNVLDEGVGGGKGMGDDGREVIDDDDE